MLLQVRSLLRNQNSKSPCGDVDICLGCAEWPNSLLYYSRLRLVSPAALSVGICTLLVVFSTDLCSSPPCPVICTLCCDVQIKLWCIFILYIKDVETSEAMPRCFRCNNTDIWGLQSPDSTPIPFSVSMSSIWRVATKDDGSYRFVREHWLKSLHSVLWDALCVINRTQ